MNTIVLAQQRASLVEETFLLDEKLIVQAFYSVKSCPKKFISRLISSASVDPQLAHLALDCVPVLRFVLAHGPLGPIVDAVKLFWPVQHKAVREEPHRLFCNIC